MQVVLYYSQTRSRQEAGFFSFRELEQRRRSWRKPRHSNSRQTAQRAAIYARVSDKSQDGDDKNSISEQTSEMEAYCEGKG